MQFKVGQYVQIIGPSVSGSRRYTKDVGEIVELPDDDGDIRVNHGDPNQGVDSYYKPENLQAIPDDLARAFSLRAELLKAKDKKYVVIHRRTGDVVGFYEDKDRAGYIACREAENDLCEFFDVYYRLDEYYCRRSE